jgi:uncharacterized membrane protein
MILTGRPAERGTNGAVSLVGSLAGAIAAFAGAGIAVAGSTIDLRGGWIVAISALIGNLLDSVLGQTVEAHLGRWGGFIVNGTASMLAGFIALAFTQMW